VCPPKDLINELQFCFFRSCMGFSKLLNIVVVIVMIIVSKKKKVEHNNGTALE